jgi:hypothetical protein
LPIAASELPEQSQEAFLATPRETLRWIDLNASRG